MTEYYHTFVDHFAKSFSLPSEQRTGLVCAKTPQKHHFPLLFFLLLIPLFSGVYAQRFNIEQTEEFLNEYWVGTPFRDVWYLHFIDSLNGHMAEYPPNFATTSDGGTTWINKKTLSGQYRDAEIIMLSRDTLFYISVNKKLVSSFDGGLTWTITGNVTGIPVDISSMVFYNRLKGICATVDGVVYTTSNGGLDWQPYPGLPYNRNTTFKIYGNLTIGYGSNLDFLLSSDQGETWQQLGYSDSINTPNFVKIMNGKLYISAAGNKYYMTDLTGQILFQEALLPLTRSVRGFAFPNENEVWSAEWDAGSKVSVPGSGVWKKSSYPQRNNVLGVFESFNGKVLVSSSGVDDGHSMMRLDGPGKKYSVKKGRLPGNYRLSAVKILSPDATFVGSYEGVIFRSTDRGLSWEIISGNNKFPAILCISAKNNMNIFAGCMGGIILRTSDGGANWTQINTTLTDNITSIDYKATDSLFLTTDKAAYVATLSNLPYPLKLTLPGNSGKIIKVKFWDRHSGFVGGYYTSHKTTNGGKTWVEEPNGYLWPTALSVMPGLAKFYLSNVDFIEIRVPNISYFNYSGFNGGFTMVDNDSTAGFILDIYFGAVVPIYIRQPKIEYFLAGGPVSLNDFDYFNAGYSLAVGDGGTLLFPAFKNTQEPPSSCTGLQPAQASKVSGQSVNFSWKEPYVLIPNEEFQIEIARDDTSDIVISQSGITTTAFTASGLTEEKRHFWRVRARNQFGWGDYTPWTTFFLMRQVYTFSEVTLPRWATINSVTQTTNGTVWAAGDSGFVARSTTQGESWEVASFPFNDDLKSSFVNPFNNTVFFSSTSGDLIYTTDNGTTWQRTPSGVQGAVVRSIFFPFETDGYLCGTNRLASRTVDGGLNWFLSSVPASATNLSAVFETTDEQVLIAADGGVLLRSTDFGRHFYPEQIFAYDNYRALFMFNSRLHLLNEYGHALTSTDQGLTWNELHLNFEGTLRQVDYSGNRFRILSNSGGLYTSTLQGDMLNFQQLPGGSAMRGMYRTSSGNLIVAGSGNHLLVGRDTAVTSHLFADEDSQTSPAEYMLYQNYPNPFNGTTVIPLRMAKAGHATIEIFSSSGEKITTLLNREIEGGDHSVIFDSGGLPSGIYFYRLTAGSARLTGKMILLK